MKARIVLGVVAILLLYLMLRPGITPIGGGWAIGRARIGSSQSLIRIGAHPSWQRATVGRGVTAYRFFKPDCVVYLGRSSPPEGKMYRAFEGKAYLAACGDRAPIVVAEAYFSITPYGLRYILKQDTFDGIPKMIERHIPIGRILAAAKKARTRSASILPITYARFPDGIEARSYGDHTALHEAVSRGDKDSVSSWLAQGVFPDLLDEKGVTPLMLTVIMQADTGLAPVLADTLLRAGADVDAQTNNGMTALMYAKRAGATNVYQLLLAWSADTTLRNARGERASEMPPVPGYNPLSR